MTKWLRESGLTVNESKTEICLFHKNDHDLISLAINNVAVRGKIYQRIDRQTTILGQIVHIPLISLTGKEELTG